MNDYLPLMITLVLCTQLGCSAIAGDRTTPQKLGWKPEDFFTDPKVIALVQAIHDNDLDEMRRLIAAGADVNAKGKDNCTPLLWAFFDDKPERFELLLQHGANPNIPLLSDLGTKGVLDKGSAVTHFAAESRFEKQFGLVMQHGGDGNLRDANDESAVFHVIKGQANDKIARLQLLVDAKADISYCSTHSGVTPAITAVGWFGQYDIALFLLRSGADPDVLQHGHTRKLIHSVLSERDVDRGNHPAKKAKLEELIQWLKDHGQDIQAAEADLERWRQPR